MMRANQRVFFSLSWVVTTKDVHTAYLRDQQKKKKLNYNRLIKQHTSFFPQCKLFIFSIFLFLRRCSENMGAFQDSSWSDAANPIWRLKWSRTT